MLYPRAILVPRAQYHKDIHSTLSIVLVSAGQQCIVTQLPLCSGAQQITMHFMIRYPYPALHTTVHVLRANCYMICVNMYVPLLMHR